MVWRGSDVQSKDDLAFDLTPRHVAALEAILAATRHLARDEIRLEHCRHPDLDQDLAGVLDEIQLGRGVVLLRGFPVDARPVADVERMFWALCTHLGPPLSQNEFGDRVLRVQEEKLAPGDQSPRGNKARRELAMHTDITEVVGLLCVRDARDGGNSQIASALAIHNEIQATRPDLMPILYRGFPYHRRGEHPESQSPVTPYNVPVFSNVDGNVSCNFVRHMVMAALGELERTPTAEELEALNAVREVAARLQYEFRLGAGEAYLVNNFVVLHSRSEFEDFEEPERKRLMLRLWLEAGRDRRPVVPEIHIHENAEGRHGVDPVPGRNAKRLEFNISQKARELLKQAGGRAA
jgi:hypothetical protein